jgi:hypothetical protein
MDAKVSPMVKMIARIVRRSAWTNLVLIVFSFYANILILRIRD